MRNKTQIFKYLPSTPPFFLASASLLIFSTSSPQAAQRDGERGLAVSLSHVLSAAPSSSLSSPASVWGPTHGRQSSINFSNAGPSHRLQFFTNCSSMGPFHVSFPRGLVLQEQTAAVWVPHEVTGPARKPALVWASLHGVTASFWSMHLLQCGVLHGLQVDICSTMDLQGLQGDSLPHHGLHHGLQGNFCSSTWSTSLLSFFTDLGVHRVVPLTYCHSPPIVAVVQNFHPPS